MSGPNPEVASKYDMLRRSVPLISKPNVFVQTRGIASLPEDDQIAIWKKVKEFKDFSPDNDPYGEHDFGSIEQNGKKIFWKIDNYNGHDGMELVLTIMFADEY